MNGITEGPTSAIAIPRAWIDCLTFSDGTEVRLGKSDVLVIVGPNNAGKSAALRAIRDKLASDVKNPVVKGLIVEREGSEDDVVNWLESFAYKTDKQSANPIFRLFGSGLHLSNVRSMWRRHPDRLDGLAGFFSHLLTADERLSGSNPAGTISFLREAPTHPIHHLFLDENLELKLSAQFKKAFGEDLVLNRLAGNEIPLHVGQRPTPGLGEDRLSRNYVEQIEKLPTLQMQGDGMRSFAGVLLWSSVGRENILLIDEPEAFLHPPQAKQLGRMLVAEKATTRQLFISTHSGDILRGVLDVGSASVRVLRIQRKNDINQVHELDNAKVLQLWADPLLRYSNILDGIFHERVVVCEGDADARFYAALASIIDHQDDSVRTPDIMFTHCGGKARIALVVRALRGVGVPVNVVVDFDVLNAEEPLRTIVDAAGGDWSEIEHDWSKVNKAVSSKKAELTASDVKNAIVTILEQVTGESFPRQSKEQIQAIFRRSSPWAMAKLVGKSFIPSGDPTQAFSRLDLLLRKIGVFVVPVGEVEGFARSVGNHGPKWVNGVLKKDIASDPELKDAREFVESLIV